MIFLMNPQDGQRNATLTQLSFTLGKKVGGGLINEDLAREILADLGASWGLGDRETTATIKMGLRTGHREWEITPAALVKQWVEDECVTGTDFGGNTYFTPTIELYRNYSEWCAESSYNAIHIVAFARTLAELGFMPMRQPIDGKLQRGFDGIGLTDDDQEDWDDFEIPLSRPTSIHPVADWTRANAIKAGGTAIESSTPASDLYASFRSWCGQSGIPNMGYRQFINTLRSWGIEEKIVGGKRVLIGIELPTHGQEETVPYPSEDDLNEYGPGLFFSQWLEQMEKRPGANTAEDALYMAYHRYCEYYRECPLTLTGFREGMGVHHIESSPDVSQQNVNVYEGIAIPASFHAAMYGDPIF